MVDRIDDASRIDDLASTRRRLVEAETDALHIRRIAAVLAIIVGMALFVVGGLAIELAMTGGELDLARARAQALGRQLDDISSDVLEVLPRCKAQEDVVGSRGTVAVFGGGLVYVQPGPEGGSIMIGSDK